MEESKRTSRPQTYGSSLFPTLGIGGLISIYQFFNERANFCLNIFGGRCEYPPEYAYPYILLLVLFVLSVLYGIWCLTRREMALRDGCHLWRIFLHTSVFPRECFRSDVDQNVLKTIESLALTRNYPNHLCVQEIVIANFT